MKNYIMASLLHASGVLASALVLLGGGMVITYESVADLALGIAILSAGFPMWISVVANARRYRVSEWYSALSLAVMLFAATMTGWYFYS
ncbi:MAG: hypothetical protein OEZ10_09990 [Gammaproteobacteria bacterium]|nr:hypothetical protein [Gammaproteobacteria bacterium]